VVVAGQPVRVAIRPGTGSGPPLLLANGIGASLETFDPLVAVLDPAIEVIRFDVPGVGGSPLPARPYRFPALARLLAGLLDQLGHPSADILGISWGGALAQQFARTARRRCRRLVLVATGTGSLMVPGNPRVLARLVTPRRYTDASYMQAIAGELYGGSARADAGAATSLLHPWSRVGPARGYLYQLAAGAGWTSLPWLPLVGQPALVLGGDDDPIIPLLNARIMTALLPRARLHVYSGGHVELLLAPRRLAPPIEQFLLGEA
jgi:poly(3-hydroxyalkanoate) depolymerase